ncbi:15819_t:CDS:2 [Funneliformis geosporum]|nr:15819_t:CDS:2 [Funneliformis geosporum]
MYYQLRQDSIHINRYYGITQDPITKDFVIIMEFYDSGDLSNYIIKTFYKVDWNYKLNHLNLIAIGLSKIHGKNIIHRDFHSGNILIKIKDLVQYKRTKIADLGLSKSATEAEDNEIYGIIPYMAPEILQGQKYASASDIYGFGMIMWECMTGRRPFWDRAHDTDLIIDICDGLRPPIDDTVAPKDYIKLMKVCWDSDIRKRPTASDIKNTPVLLFCTSLVTRRKASFFDGEN